MPSLPAAEPLGDWKRYDPKYRAVGDYFGIDPSREWSKYSDKIEYFHNWAKNQTGTDDINSNLAALQKLERTMKPPAWDERRIVAAYRTIRINESNPVKEKPKVIKKEEPQDLATSVTNLKQQLSEKINKSVSESINKEIKTALKTQVDGLKNALKSI